MNLDQAYRTLDAAHDPSLLDGQDALQMAELELQDAANVITRNPLAAAIYITRARAWNAIARHRQTQAYIDTARNFKPCLN